MIDCQKFGEDLADALAAPPTVQHYRVVDELRVGQIDI